MNNVEKKIKRVTESGFDVHHIFKKVLNKKIIFREDEEIVDLIFIKREHMNERDESSPVASPGKLIVATTEGLIFVQEGFEEIANNYLGYKIEFVSYEKVSGIEFDICLLEGKLVIYTDSSDEANITLEFNSAKYYDLFEDFLDKLRSKIAL
jgi:hypothetical protein